MHFLIKVSRQIYASFILSQKRGQSQIPQVKSLQHATHKHSPFELFINENTANKFRRNFKTPTWNQMLSIDDLT